MQNTAMRNLILVLGITIGAEAANYLKEKPEHLKSCRLADADFKKCFAANFQTLFREWKDGVPGLKSVGKLDPLIVSRLQIAEDSTNTLMLHADLSNMLVKGASKAVIEDASLNIEKRQATFIVFMPRLRFASDFQLKGRALAIALNGNGKAKFEAGNIRMEWVVNMKWRDQDELTFTDIDSIKMQIKELGSFQIRLENLFGGRKELEESTNAVFNENWREFYGILKPIIEEANERILTDRFKKVFAFVPASYFVADIPKARDL